MIIKFDATDIKEMRDLPRIVADTPVDKEVPVVIIRKGQEQIKTVKLGRLEDGEKAQAVAVKPNDKPDANAVKKTLGIDLSPISDDLRKKYKIKDAVKGIVIVGVDAGSAAADKRLSAGRRDRRDRPGSRGVARRFPGQGRQAQGRGPPPALLLVAGADGELRFIALALQ